jgi:hypothetical protein
MKAVSIVAGSLCAGLLGSACAYARVPEVPESLRVPAGQELSHELLAQGFQVYECVQAAESPARFEWKFKAPEATLSDRSGRSMGRHYAGPTWQAPDGSAVVAEVRARERAQDPAAIPYLLLAVKSATGTGSFERVRTIQRLETAGGVAPSGPCTAAQVARVPYTATYYFYAEKR